jgi:Flp pilus assembly protein CpaB
MDDSSRRRRLLLMFLGLVLALIAGFATLLLASQPRPDTVIERVPVVVAARDIDPRTELALDDLRVVELPREAVLPQAYTQTTQAEGRLTTVRIHAGQQMTEFLFIGTDQDPLSIVPPEIEEITDDTEYYRAVSISVPRNRAVAGQLQDGDRVDLLVTVNLAMPVQAVLDPETGDISYQAVEHALPVIDPETGELKGIVGGQSTKITIPDLVILRAAVEEGLYILRVNLNQAEQINHIIQTAPDSFSLVLRPGQDTRPIDPELYGETTDAIIMNYLYQVPFLVDLDELLGFPIEPIEGLPTPPTPEPVPEPSPEPPDNGDDEEP